MQIPEWVRKNPEILGKRFLLENSHLQEYKTFVQNIDQKGKHLIIGKLVTNINNVYTCKIYVPDNFPYEPPIVIITDKDVIRNCLNRGLHELHHLGRYKDGIELCIFKEDSMRGLGWLPYYSITSLIIWTAEWLHAYEEKLATGRWPLPE